MELGHLLTCSSLTYPEVSSNVCHNSFCQLENSVSLPWVIYYEAFYLRLHLTFYVFNKRVHLLVKRILLLIVHVYFHLC